MNCFLASGCEICNVFSGTLEKCVFTEKMMEMSSIRCAKCNVCHVSARLEVIFWFLPFFSVTVILQFIL